MQNNLLVEDAFVEHARFALRRDNAGQHQFCGTMLQLKLVRIVAGSISALANKQQLDRVRSYITRSGVIGGAVGHTNAAQHQRFVVDAKT